MAVLPPPPDFRGPFHTDARHRAAYSEGAGPYRIIPRAVALPADRDDIVALVRYAAAEGVPLTPRGAGSGMPGGNVGSGVVVDLSALDRPCRVSLQQTANVGCAVTWGTLDHVAGHFGFRLPPDPSSGAFCTLGGMVATNAAGARSLRAGSIRRWVRGVEFVSADGEAGWLARHEAARTVRAPTPRRLADRLALEDRFKPVADALRVAAGRIRAGFPATRKNSSGYALDHYLESGDLVDLVIGSEGTLGIVTRIELALERRPEATGTLLVGLPDHDDLGAVVDRLLARDPVAVELFDETFLRLAGADLPVQPDGVQAVLLAAFEGRDPGAVARALEEAAAALPRGAVVRRATDDAGQSALWALRHAASPRLAALAGDRRSLQVIEDGCVPVPALGQYLQGVRAAAARAGVDIVAFGHAGDGHLHVNALVDVADAGFAGRLAGLLEEVTALVVRLGGTPSGEHGDGRLRAHALQRCYGPEIAALFRQVKAAFDPRGVFNPGVIVPGPEAPLDRLKVGPAAASIPDDVAQALRHRERTGGWATSPLTLLEGVP